MAVNPNWPLTVTQFSTSDPFDPNAVDVWQDISTRVREFAAANGKQYELDTQQSGEASIVASDKDEALNPTNPGSPYSPNLKPYRQIIDQEMWPPSPLGGAVNLLVGQITPVVDPTFESYTAGQSPPWILTVGSGVTPTVSTSNPQQGTKDLQYTVTNGAGECGVGFTVTTIPNQQYTASLFVRQTAGNTTQIFIDGGAGGSSTTTTAAYVRLTVTFTATQPTHQVWVASFTTTITGTVNVDALQVEPGASASTFSSVAGPVIYSNWAGYVERWPSRWNHFGLYGMCEVSCIDGLAILAGQFLSTEYRNSVLAKAPAYYWPMSEPQAATTFADVSGNGGPSLVLYNPSASGAAAATVTPGTSTAIPGDANGAGVAYTGTGSQFADMVVGEGNRTRISFAGNTASWGASMSFWFNTSDGSAVILCGTVADSAAAFPQFTPAWDVAGKLLLNLALDGTHFLNTADTASSYADGAWHHVVATITQGSNTTATTLYIDGSSVASASANSTTTFGSSTPDFRMNRAWTIGGSSIGAPGRSSYGTYAHFALWNRALSSGEVSDLYTAGERGYTGETSGARIARYLSYNWIGPTNIDAGLSVMGVSNLADNTSVLDAIQSVATDENGNMWIDGTGTPQFRSRAARYLAVTPKWVFGENAGAGQNPYGPDVAYDYDPTLIFNDVEITRSGGVTAIGGRQATIAASIKSYGKRSYTITINISSDNETQDHADWIFAGHDQPTQRVATLSINPSANPALWPVALGAQIGDRVTVVRTTAAGYTMTGDYFIERREQRRAAGVWTFNYQMSPTGPFQPGILDDTTYGRLATAGASLHSPITNSATTASVDLTGGDLFTTTGTPFKATIGGEVVTVTTVSGSSSPQTFTITRPTDGTAVAHLAGVAVQTANPVILAF